VSVTLNVTGSRAATEVITFPTTEPYVPDIISNAPWGRGFAPQPFTVMSNMPPILQGPTLMTGSQISINSNSKLSRHSLTPKGSIVPTLKIIGPSKLMGSLDPKPGPAIVIITVSKLKFMV
jgi:hypothetical protein